MSEGFVDISGLCKQTLNPAWPHASGVIFTDVSRLSRFRPRGSRKSKEYQRSMHRLGRRISEQCAMT
jgi:hypothetical protein